MLAASSQIDLMVGGTEGLMVLGVENQLVTALRNLLTNAISYSPRGTRVAVATRLADGVVEISVTDQGMGIPENELRRVFERFYRVDQARSRVTGGTGLGLAIVKHVAENHGGEVAVWSVPGEGSTFTLRLPAHPALEAAEPSAEAAVVEKEKTL
jgi:two-component system sensor histidine kinase SenX3